VGLDGYNWGTSKATTHWKSFAQLFDSDLRALQRIAPRKPIFLAEVGSVGQGGSKPEWIAQLVNDVLRAPHVAGFAWFDFDQASDNWSINSSRTSRLAFKSALHGH
jgi:mannan endo-1,4-beta-mannosidase